MEFRTLYVPSNVSLRNEVWRGLSVADSIKCIINAVVAAAAGAALHFLLGLSVLWCVFGALTVAMVSVAVLQRFESNLSMMDYFRISIKFSREQKRYHYVYRRKTQ